MKSMKRWVEPWERRRLAGVFSGWRKPRNNSRSPARRQAIHLRCAMSVLSAALLCGCFQVEDELTLAPDGSGNVKLTIHNELPAELTGVMGMYSSFGGVGPMYPPVSESDARRFFPAKDFTVKAEEKDAAEGKTLLIEANFKDVNALLASPYGRAHQLAIRTNGNASLIVQALSGGATMAQAAQFKAEGEMAGEVPGIEEAQKKKGEMRFEFRVTLPNAVAKANEPPENKSVSWTVERAKCKDDEEFANKLAGVLEASCSAEGLKFSPVTPTRLGLLPFNQLTPGTAAAATALPDTNKIMTAARFVPYALHVTRTLDLSGEGSGQGSQAELTGAILLPSDLAPQRWGEAKLEEATDAKGNSLMPKEERDTFTRYSRFGDMPDQMDDEEQDDTAKQSAEKPRIVTLRFKAPDWKVKQITKIKGSMALQYFGGAEIVKVTNAVPANLVMDMSKRSGFSMNADSERGQIAHSRLTELGLSLQVQNTMVEGGMTVISMESSGGKAALMDVQVFDVDGRPWPTMLMQPDSGGGDDHSCEIMVAGKPKPPFSLALAVSGAGTSVGVPILVENVPVGEK